MQQRSPCDHNCGNTSTFAWRGGGGNNNVPSNNNFVCNLFNRHYRNKLADVLIDIQAILLRAVVASGVPLPKSSMVDRTCIRALWMMMKKDPPLLMPWTKKQGEIGEIYSLLTFGFQITTRRIFYFYIYSLFCDQSLCCT
jgi:hypothetical protein